MRVLSILMIYLFIFFNVIRGSIMQDNVINHEENIAKILNRVVSLCEKTGLSELVKKGEKVLENYDKSKKLR